MHRVWILLLMVVPAAAGCALCCGDDDYNYSAYGGAWQREDMSHGRVGSAFATPSELLAPSLEALELPPGEVLELPEGELNPPVVPQ